MKNYFQNKNEAGNQENLVQLWMPAVVRENNEILNGPIGRPVRLGAWVIGDGVDFAVRAGNATLVELCLFEVNEITGELHETRHELVRGFQNIWAGHVPGVKIGQLYGYRVHGKWDPKIGMMHNPAKVLLDPYARAIGQVPQLNNAIYGYENYEKLTLHDAESSLEVPEINGDSASGEVRETNYFSKDNRDSAPYAALGMVVADTPADNTFPRTPWQKTVIYEAHVVGLTKNFTALPEEIRGTYAGLGHQETIKYLTDLGITALELLPIHAKFSEPFLALKNLENYWGYNTLSYFAPEPSYATKSAQEIGPHAVIEELKQAIQNLHSAGIEVLLDVVYNHTCEAGAEGPTLSLRGLDNTSYYRHNSRQIGQLVDTTGCGNSLDFRRISVIQLTLDSLRYWVEVMGVDGFRFDLAVTLGREGDNFNSSHPLYRAMATDPVLCDVKLINEPWDLGPNGWQTGNFPAPCADWNDHFRDTVRSFWVNEPGKIMHGGVGNDIRDLATRLSGSADLFNHGITPGGRGIYASINFVTVHDGFTMRDVVSYNHKHNEANLEGNRDGSENNSSWNHGEEGGNDFEIEKFRQKSVRNLFGTLIFSAGTPMIAAGDEIYKTQFGNNNAYCQNSQISYLAWDGSEVSKNMFATVSYLLRLRREHITLRPNRFYTGEFGSDGICDLEWFDAFGQRLADYQWFDCHMRTIQMLRSGKGVDVDVLLVLNGAIEDVELRLTPGRGENYRLVWDSNWEKPRTNTEVYAPGAPTRIGAMSMQVYFTEKSE